MKMKWKHTKYSTNSVYGGVYYIAICKLSPTEWEWIYDEYGCGETERSCTYSGTMVKCPKPNALKCSYIVSIPNLWNTFGHDTRQEPIGGKTIHDTVMRVVEYYKQQEKVTL